MALVVKPAYETGHQCKVCGVMTPHDYLGPQRDNDGHIALHLWNCRVCKATVSLDSPEKVALRAFRRETRRMRQRRSKRRWG